MKAPVNLISGLLLLKFTFAELNIYGHLDPQTLAEGFQTTTACIFALNQTVHCNERRAVVASIADSYYWALDDVITLCTPQCQQSLNSWISDVDAACGNRPIVEDGIIKLASSIPLTYKEGFDLVCLKSGDSWCILESQEWAGSDIMKYPADYCSSGDPEYDGKECYEEGFDQLAIEPEDERMANLYDKDLLCSGCFLKIFRQRLLSPFLLKGGYTSYLVEQFEDMQLKCSTSMPYTTSTSEVFMGTVTRTTPTASPPPASTTCQGPIIKPADPPLSCTDIADKYNVTSGEVHHRTGNIDCEFSKPLCLPEPCEIAVVPLDSTCTSFLQSHSSSTFNVTINQFLNWNPYLSGSCELMNWYQRVCIRPPGGSYESQLPVHQSTAASQYYTPAIPPAPTSTGTTASCGRYYEVVAGDQCNTIARHFGITVDEFLTLNTQVDERCSNLWIAYAYCFKWLPNQPTVYAVQITVIQLAKARVLDIVAQPVDIVDQLIAIVAQDTVTLGNVPLATERPLPKMGDVVPNIMIGSVGTRLLGNAALSMDTVGIHQTSAQQGIATQEPATQTLVGRVLMVRAGQALQETRHALALILVNVVVLRDLVEMGPTTVHTGNAILGRVKDLKRIQFFYTLRPLSTFSILELRI
ncbi:hypothetical protein MferCBS49748_003422 [Microsporum ferrugineum]